MSLQHNSIRQPTQSCGGGTTRREVRRVARRGAAMMMVLSVVSVGSILSWAMLQSAAMRSAVVVNAADSIDAEYLAQSGASYALYYLRYPAKSPVALTTGAFNSFYGGQTNVRLWSDAPSTVNIAVTNTAKDCYTVRVTAAVNGTRRVIETDVKQVTVGYPITVAAGFNGPYTIPNTMQINGPVISQGAVNNQAGHVTGSGAIVPTGSPVLPIASDVLILEETGTPYTGSGALATDRTYTYNGKTYAAEKLPATVSGTLASSRSALNPKNVWYSDAGVTFLGVTMTGTVVMRNNAPLTLIGTNKVTASDGMAAMVIWKQVELRHQLLATANLTVNGAMWLGDRITATTYLKNDGYFNVNGALLLASTTGSTPAVSLTGDSTSTIKYVAANVSKVDNLSKTRTIVGVNTLAWRSVE